MKNLKQIITQIQAPDIEQSGELNNLLWQLICYPPKLPVRLQQEQLLNTATKFTLSVKDEYFTHKELNFNGFKWGSGTRKILITHGWGSKAADFSEIITKLNEIDDLQVIAFDAPGNGSSEGELSNLLLFVQAIKSVVFNYGYPDIVIGHSLGAMANIIVLNEMAITPSLLISLTPLIRLKENFEATMSSVGISGSVQDNFLKDFEDKFNRKASLFNLNDWYTFDVQLKHWLAYDQDDLISPYSYIEEFLGHYKFIKAQNYKGVGHEKILKVPQLVNDLMNIVEEHLNK